MIKLDELHELQVDKPYANSHLDSVYPCARTGTRQNHLSMCAAIKATKPDTGLSASCKSPIEHVL